MSRGSLALQTGPINQAALVAAFYAWTQNKARPLADHLVALGHQDAAHRPPLEGLAVAHLACYRGDTEKSLAAIPGVSVSDAEGSEAEGSEEVAVSQSPAGKPVWVAPELAPRRPAAPS